MGAVRSQSTGAMNAAKPGEPESVRCVKRVTRTMCRNDTAAATRGEEEQVSFHRVIPSNLQVTDGGPPSAPKLPGGSAGPPFGEAPSWAANFLTNNGRLRNHHLQYNHNRKPALMVRESSSGEPPKGPLGCRKDLTPPKTSHKNRTPKTTVPSLQAHRRFVLRP